MKSVIKAAAGALLTATVIGVPANAGDSDPQLGTYLVWNFGGAQEVSSNNFQYGLRLDYDSRMAARELAPPLLVLNVGDNSGADAFLNGSSLRGMALRMNQAGAAGGGAALTTAAVVAGVAATAVVVSSTDDNDDSPSGGATGDTAGGGTGGTGGGTGGTGGGTGGTGGGTGGTGGGTGGTGDVPLGGLLGSGLSDMRGKNWQYASSERRDVAPEYQQWLDGGTGQMGDLGN